MEKAHLPGALPRSSLDCGNFWGSDGTATLSTVSVESSDALLFDVRHAVSLSDGLRAPKGTLNEPHGTILLVMARSFVREHLHAAPLQAEDHAFAALMLAVLLHFCERQAFVAAPIGTENDAVGAEEVLMALEAAEGDLLLAQGAGHGPQVAAVPAVRLHLLGGELAPAVVWTWHLRATEDIGARE